MYSLQQVMPKRLIRYARDCSPLPANIFKRQYIKKETLLWLFTRFSRITKPVADSFGTDTGFILDNHLHLLSKLYVSAKMPYSFIEGLYFFQEVRLRWQYFPPKIH
jgi:hypothetical protein